MLNVINLQCMPFPNTHRAPWHIKQVYSFSPETYSQLSAPNAGAQKKPSAVTVTSKMDVLQGWIQLWCLVQILNVKWRFWPLWAQHFTILAHAKECTMTNYWHAPGFMMFFIIGHTSVSRVLIYKTYICITKCLYWKKCFFQWCLGKSVELLPNLLMTPSKVTHGHGVNSQAR